MASPDYDILFKVLLLGKSCIIKSSLLFLPSDGLYRDNLLPTIGIDFKIKKIEIEGKTVKLQVWDTLGSTRPGAVDTSYYRGTRAVVVVYDVKDRESFDCVHYWMKEVDRLAPPGICRFLVGNKTDLDDRVVTEDEGRSLAEQYGSEYIETSVCDDTNVDQVLTKMAQTMQKKQELSGSATGGAGGRQLRQISANLGQ